MSKEGQGMIMGLSDQEILERIAYSYYERYKNLGLNENKHRDWDMALRVFKHFTTPIEERSWRWNIDDEDYSDYKELFNDR